MGAHLDEQTDNVVGQATTIAMDRYELSESGAHGLLGRLAGRHKVTICVVAAAIVAAEVARRRM
jgi:AmiR/NasT family two-component response regulator